MDRVWPHLFTQKSHRRISGRVWGTSLTGFQKSPGLQKIASQIDINSLQNSLNPVERALRRGENTKTERDKLSSAERILAWSTCLRVLYTERLGPGPPFLSFLPKLTILQVYSVCFPPCVSQFHEKKGLEKNGGNWHSARLLRLHWTPMSPDTPNSSGNLTFPRCPKLRQGESQRHNYLSVANFGR